MKSFLDRIDNKIEVDHHDMGFLYSPSCVAAYKLIGSKEGREAAIKAADQLITRYHSRRRVHSGLAHGCSGELPSDH